MKRKLLRGMLALVFLLSMSGAEKLWAESSVDVGKLAALKLRVPNDETDRMYLGLRNEAEFTIPQIQAEVVIIEIFSMYCPYCQKDAPQVNALYETIEKGELQGRIKVIGIGAGNSAFEVGVFKKTYAIPFPLFADDDFAIHQACGEVRTPHYLAVRIGTENDISVFHSHTGGIEDPDAFLADIRSRAGM
jgi:peroxiredoxin